MESTDVSPGQLIRNIQNDPDLNEKHKMSIIRVKINEFAATTKDHFYDVLPTDLIKRWLEIETPKIRACFQEGELDKFEPVGSTSVPGMCGMLAPDIGIFVNVFPPSDQTLLNLQKLGYEFVGFYTHNEENFDDIWMMRSPDDWKEENIKITSTIHMWKHGSIHAEQLLTYRDLLRTDKQVFDEYRNKKLEMMHKEHMTGEELIKYKMEKGKVAAAHLVAHSEKKKAH